MFACYSGLGLLLGRVESLQHAPHWAQFGYAIYERGGPPATELDQLCDSITQDGRQVALRVKAGEWTCSLIGRGPSAVDAVHAALNDGAAAAERVATVMREGAA